MSLTGVPPYGLFRALLPRPQACSVPSTGARMDRRPNGDITHMAPKSNPAVKDPDIHKVERLSIPYSHQRAGVRQRRRRRDAERARHSLHRAQSGRELSRPARQHRQLPRQRAAADAAVPARGGRGRDRARLRQGHRQGDGGGGALQRRAVPRHHGDLQRLVRSHADPDPRRHRPGRRDEAPAVDRLDSHRRRPGRDHPQLQQVGRPAGVGRAPPASRCCAPTGWRTPRRAVRPTSTSMPRCRRASSPAPLPPIDVKRYMPPVVTGPSAELVKQAVDLLTNAKKPLILAGRVSRNIDDWNRRVQLAEALDARVCTNLKIGAAFPTDHPLHLGSPATFATDDLIAAVKEADVILSLDWVDLGGTFKADRRSAVRHRHPGLARPEPAQRLEHGLRGAAGGRSVHPGRDRRHRRGAARRHRVEGQAEEAAPRARARAEAQALARRRDGGRRHGQRAAPRGRRPHGLPDPRLAVLARRVLAVPSSARLHRLRRRRRRRRRARHLGRRRARAQGHRPHADRGLRRRRLHDGLHGGVDRGALPHSAADRGGQQPLVLQRRGPPGAGGGRAQPSGRQQVDRPAHQRSGHRHGHRGARPGRQRLRSVPQRRRAGEGADGGDRGGRERRRRRGRCPHPRRLQPGDRRAAMARGKA